MASDGSYFTCHFEGELCCYLVNYYSPLLGTTVESARRSLKQESANDPIERYRRLTETASRLPLLALANSATEKSFTVAGVAVLFMEVAKQMSKALPALHDEKQALRTQSAADPLAFKRLLVPLVHDCVRAATLAHSSSYDAAAELKRRAWFIHRIVKRLAPKSRSPFQPSHAPSSSSSRSSPASSSSSSSSPSPGSLASAHHHSFRAHAPSSQARALPRWRDEAEASAHRGRTSERRPQPEAPRPRRRAWDPGSGEDEGEAAAVEDQPGYVAQARPPRSRTPASAPSRPPPLPPAALSRPPPSTPLDVPYERTPIARHSARLSANHPNNGAHVVERKTRLVYSNDNDDGNDIVGSEPDEELGRGGVEDDDDEAFGYIDEGDEEPIGEDETPGGLPEAEEEEEDGPRTRKRGRVRKHDSHDDKLVASDVDECNSDLHPPQSSDEDDNDDGSGDNGNGDEDDDDGDDDDDDDGEDDKCDSKEEAVGPADNDDEEDGSVTKKSGRDGRRPLKRKNRKTRRLVQRREGVEEEPLEVEEEEDEVEAEGEGDGDGEGDDEDGGEGENKGSDSDNDGDGDGDGDAVEGDGDRDNEEGGQGEGVAVEEVAKAPSTESELDAFRNLASLCDAPFKMAKKGKQDRASPQEGKEKEEGSETNQVPKPPPAPAPPPKIDKAPQPPSEEEMDDAPVMGEGMSTGKGAKHKIIIHLLGM